MTSTDKTEAIYEFVRQNINVLDDMTYQASLELFIGFLFRQGYKITKEITNDITM